MKYGYVTQLASFKDQERFCLWIVHVLERLINAIEQSVTAKSDRRLRQAFEYVEANYSKRLPVDEVARHVSLSPSRLSHIMKSELGITLSDYVTRTRINKAKALLLETEMSVCQVALEVGYPDQSYFTKAFKALEGCTPKTFRHEGGQVALSPIPTRPGGRRRKSRQWTA
jgi:two-component system response regulator YesN